MPITSPELSSLPDEIMGRLLEEFNKFIRSGYPDYHEVFWHDGKCYVYQCVFDAIQQKNHMYVYRWEFHKQPKRVLKLEMKE